MQVVYQEIQQHLPTGDESRRLFHGRGHCFPGYEDLLIDWFKPILLITLYRSREKSWLAELVELLRAEFPAAEAVLLQERFIFTAPTRLLWGNPPVTVDALEAGLRYRLRLTTAKNIGFFLDMARGRELVRNSAKDKRVLNLFAYSCGFSVAALAGGAMQVVNLDMNRGALDLGCLNHQINQLDLRQASFLPLELFRSFNRLKRLAPFDLIICDPPAEQGKSFKAERDWSKLLRKLPALLAPGGEILACLNAPYLPPDFLQRKFSELLPDARLQTRIESGDDFPEQTPDKGVWIFHYLIPNA